MTTSDPNVVAKLEALVRQRESHQISEWKFEQSKRELLGETPMDRSEYRRDVIFAVRIGVALVLIAVFGLPKHTYIPGTSARIEKRNMLEQYQDFQEQSDEMAEGMFGPVKQRLER